MSQSSSDVAAAVPHDASRDGIGSAVHAALETVIDPCCRDRGISVVEMGLVHRIEVDGHGHARVEVTLTSGWCPFQIDLVEQIGDAALSVPDVTTADVDIVLDPVWSPQRMSESARARLRLLPEPGEVADRDAYLATRAVRPSEPRPDVTRHRRPAPTDPEEVAP